MTNILFSLLITVVFWNLENFFDWKNEGRSRSDAEFSPRGTRHWTYEKCRQKAVAVGKTFLWAGCDIGSGDAGLSERCDAGSRGTGFGGSGQPERCDIGSREASLPERCDDGSNDTGSRDAGIGRRDGQGVCRPPDIIGVAEVENARVVAMLSGSDALRKYGYAYVHYDSRDRRGIDVALLYRRTEFECLKKCAVPIVVPVVKPVIVQQREDHSKGGMMTDTLATRDILHVVLRLRADGSIWHIFVNHHPSKLGGAQGSEKRVAAMKTLRRCIDSLQCFSNPSSGRIIVMGDFNDTPDAPAFALLEGPLHNLGARSPAVYPDRTAPCGSIRYNGRWQLIDNFLVDTLSASRAVMEVLAPGFLLERDRKHPGLKPRRTYIGPRYNGGLSDHLPIRLTLE